MFESCRPDHNGGLMGVSKEWKAAYFQRNKSTYRLNQRSLYLKKREVILTAKDRPCADCNKRFHYVVMDFDHIGRKKFVIGQHGHKVSMSKLVAEIAQCEVVCSNCHRLRTYKRAQGPVV